MRLEPFSIFFMGVAVLGLVRDTSPWDFIGFMALMVSMILASAAIIKDVQAAKEAVK